MNQEASSPYTPHCTVATVVERQQRYLLVLEERNGRLLYNQPAGHLEAGESLIEAAARETLEETAWNVQIRAYLGVSLYRAPANGVTYVRHSFSGRAMGFEPERALDSGIVEAVWLDITEIEALRDHLASPLVYQDILRYRQDKLYPLEMADTYIAP
ncbi:NUDIX hydrolase [Pseudoteredinibacter isoporae]|uniref:Phosphatase NudJ n=1 Tax=Pseudoteredinibacter isoporae TaxID=570281 RepID=A0A7X0JSU0_9GAMM|nr:NUDIX hydrolase [Pseudoteredinibacter isoporae]MBB6521607.1 8-oxo-dGTP pyrophosphatase MutT (NUDIX family) [Pseudoteredinibacter isoporae]NHO87161.1 NUDIX hydrolase [Pseudoteredinibacter isoporae]NIB22985.1 NUDIX hydrolase [Pseudoteredinibacter isoporae]